MIDYEIKIWNGEKLGTEICIDTETDLAPFYTRDHNLVTCQAYDGSGTVFFVPKKLVRRFLNVNKNAVLIFQNAPFDVGVLGKITGMNMWYEKYDNNLIRDTKILYKLYVLAAIGEVPYKSSLKDICLKLLNRNIDKNEDVRCTFEQFLGWPIGDIPEEHLKYAADDAVHTFDAYKKLLYLISDHDKYNTLLSHDIQVKGDWALDCIYKNGIGFDLSAKADLVESATKELDVLQDRLAMWGYVRGKPGINGIFEDILKTLGIYDKLPKTATGKPSSASDDLDKFRTIPFIDDYLEFNALEKAISFIKDIHTDVVRPKYNVLLNTGRTSCSGAGNGAVNIQQLPRLGGIREVFIPKKEGNVFVDIDYSAIELSTLSQVLLTLYGHSRMAELINAGADLHYATATSIYNKPKKDITKEERQFAKIPNFAYPTNMAPSTFVDYCKPMGINITEQEAADVKEAWLAAYPEIRKYFSEPNKHVDGQSHWGKDTYEHYTLTGRKRAACTYTAFLNTGFQGLAADGLKLAMYEITKAGYEIVAEIHDQIVVECSKEEAEKVMSEVSKIMVEQMRKVVPDVDVKVEGNIIERFTK